MDQQLGATDKAGSDRSPDRPYATIDRAAMRRFLELGTMATLAPGDVAIAAGQVPDGIHLLLSGRLSIERDGQPLAELEPGDFFNDGALFDAEASLATVRALVPATCLCIPREAALDYVALYPEFGVALCARLVRRSRVRLAKSIDVYVAHRRLAERVELQNANLRQAICSVEQTARLISQSPHPVLRVAASGMLLFANGPAEPILRHWQCTIGGRVPAGWSELVATSLGTRTPQAFEAAIGDRVFGVTITPLPDLDYANVYALDVTEARRKTAQIEHMALHDDLTGLANRAALRRRLDELTHASNGSHRAGALILIDLEGLEPIRALFGHPVSDTLLIEAGRRLERVVGAAGLVATLGGHQFAALHETSRVRADEGRTTEIAEAIVASLSQPFAIDTHRLQVGVRLGITFVDAGARDSSAEALKRADLAKHQPAAAAGAPYSFYRADLEATLREQHVLEIELHRAIGTEQIEVVYQPKVRIADGRIVGAEALVRWRHPSNGVIAPERFVPIAEQTGAIRRLGEQVLRTACRTAADWPAEDLHIAVNLSALQLRQADIAERIAAILDETGLAPHRLDLEITESLLVEDTERAAETLDRLRALGVRLSLDDFGTGYSCLSYLAGLKFDKLKIDRSFVSGMHRSREMRKIAQTIVRLGANLEMVVVAEGIEQATQWRQLHELGCAEGQGYLFSPPLSRAGLSAVLAASPVLPLNMSLAESA